VNALLALAVSAVALGVGAPLVLRRLRGLERWPTLTAWLWLAAPAGALAAVTLAGLLLLLPTRSLGMGVAELLRTCVMALRAALSTPHDSSAGTVAGVLLVAAVAGGVVLGGSVAGLRAWRAAGRHRELLALAGRPAAGLAGVIELEHGRPFAYCLPGRPGPVVVSSAALRRLDAGQLAAVLAHERAHQASRHHRLVLLAQVLRVGFPWLPAAPRPSGCPACPPPTAARCSPWRSDACTPCAPSASPSGCPGVPAPPAPATSWRHPTTCASSRRAVPRP